MIKFGTGNACFLEYPECLDLIVLFKKRPPDFIHVKRNSEGGKRPEEF